MQVVSPLSQVLQPLVSRMKCGRTPSLRCVRALYVGRLGLLTATCILTAAMVHAASSGTATLEGTVSEAASIAPIVGASVKVDGSGAVTDSTGAFAFKDLTPGSHVVVIAVSGHRKIEQPIVLAEGVNKLPPIALELIAVELTEVIVNGSTSEARSTFDDKSATDTLTETMADAAAKVPNAQSSADLLKDVSGVAVSKGANGSSNVSIRGIDQRMLRITIDGQRQGGSGNPLDNIPAEIVQSLEVTKTFTPDMEGDAVGGTININTGGTVMKEGYIQGRHQVSYNALAPHPGTRNSLTIGQPFGLFSDERNASVLTTLSFEDQYSSRERVSVLREWTPQVSPGPDPYVGQLIPVLTLPIIESTREHRQRTGFVFNGDARLGDLAVYVRSNFGRDWASRNRNLSATDPAAGSVLSLTPTAGVFSGVPLSRRNQEQETQRDASNLSVGAKSTVGRVELDGAIAYALIRDKEPRTLETGFLSNDTYRASYDFSGDPYEPRFDFVDETNAGDFDSAQEPTRYHFDYLSLTRSDLDEHDTSAKFNVKINLADGASYLKLGARVEQRRRKANVDREFFDPGAQALTMAGLVGRSLVTFDTLDYRFGPVPNAESVASLLTLQPGELASNVTRTLINSATGDYSVSEDMWALYGMAKWRLGEWGVLAGMRVEGTSVSSGANQMLLGLNGQLEGFAAADARNDYIEYLPGLHVRYEAQPGLLYRGSITRSMSRPSNADIAPYRTLSFVDHRSRIGAPDLKPYLATNLDLSVDKYDDAYGLLSFAVFYKKIDHFITDAQYPVEIGNLGTFIEFKRVNGEAAKAMGFEFSWQSRPAELPFALGRGSVEANYSYNHGTAHHPTRPTESFPLPRQVDHQGSLKFHDERGPVSLDGTVSYRAGWWEDLIAPALDNYITSAWDSEVSTAYKLNRKANITLGASNLFDRPTRHYAGSQVRMNDWQKNGVEFSLRVQWKM
jgi:TonB-dependent receptor